MADQLGSWWEDRRSKVRTSTYSSGPIGRMDPADVMRLVNFCDKQAKK